MLCSRLKREARVGSPGTAAMCTWQSMRPGQRNLVVRSIVVVCELVLGEGMETYSESESVSVSVV